MATTTNYGWTTPDDTALVKDGAAAIRTLGTSVDTTTKALNPSTTLGDIEYRSSTANTNTRLGIGTTGQVLSVSGGVPAWATVSSGGMTLLSTTSVSGSSTTISSIAQTHKHLLILGSGLYVNSNNDMFIRLNGNTGSNYFRASIVGTSSASASINTSQTELNLGGVTTNTGYDNSTFFQMNIYRYTETEYKNITASMRANADQQRIHQYAFNSTAAITSITIGVPTSFSGGTIYIYGVS